MLHDALSEDVANFAEMVQEAEDRSPGTAREVLQVLADILDVDASVKQAHPIMRRDPQMVFPDYRKRRETALAFLEHRLQVYDRPEVKLRFLMYLDDSQVWKKLGAGRAKLTTNERVVLALLVLADEYLEVQDAQSRVGEKLDLPQPHVSRSFQRLIAEGLLTLVDKTKRGKGVWRLETPHVSVHSETE